MKTISYIAVAAFAVVAIAMVSVSTAFAAGQFANGSLGYNQDAGNSSNECALAQIGNHTSGYGVVSNSQYELCWNKNDITANAGDTINLRIKLKNIGNQVMTSPNFKVTGFNPNSSTAQSGVDFGVTLSDNGGSTEYDGVGFDISGIDQTVSYIRYHEVYYDNGNAVDSGTFSTSTAMFGSSGQNINQPIGIGDYVYITAIFKIGNDTPAPTYNPSVNVSGTSTVPAGTSANVSWNSNDVSTCTFTSSPTVSQWNNNSGTTGSSSYVLSAGTYSFTANCIGLDGTPVQDTHQLTVTSNGGNQGTAPTVDITVNDSTIQEGDNVVVTWTITNADHCIYDATPNLSYFDGKTGIYTSSNSDTYSLNEDTNFEITCTNNYGLSASDNVSVDVSSGSHNNNDEPKADTDDAEDVDEDSAKLNGSVDMNDFDNGVVFFVYGQNKNDIEDVDNDFDTYSDVDNDGQDIRKVRVDSDLDGDEDYRKTVTGLDTNETYYFRICVEYEDENNDDTLECGDVEKFVTDTDYQVVTIDQPGNNGVDSVVNPIVVTLPESSVTGTSAVLNAGYNANGCSAFSTQFLIGTSTSNMNVSTGIVTRGNNSGIMRESISGLTPGVTYYVRAVGYCNGIPVYGDFESFRTPGRVISTVSSNTSTVTRVNTNTATTITSNTLEAGSGLGCIALNLTNNVEGVTRGQTLVYEVEWENLCKQDFEDAILDVKLAKELEFLSTTRGTYTGKTEHSVIIDLGDIESEEKGDMMITVRVRPGANIGQAVVVEANLGGDGVGNGIQDTAIEFDFDQVYDAAIGFGSASAFLSGFFTSVWGWLLTLLLLALLLLAARYFYVQGKRAEGSSYGYAYAPAYAQAPMYHQPQYMMPAAPMQPMHPVQPMYAPAPVAQAPANLPQAHAAAPQAVNTPDYTVYRPAPFDGSQN
ncbi:hypothetical protein H6776_00490 [Candidatus Nomurabacteria bacterium]|nr:hypothetical protein [Candidatus Nomurabacteria bacterium]